MKTKIILLIIACLFVIGIQDNKAQLNSWGSNENEQVEHQSSRLSLPSERTMGITSLRSGDAPNPDEDESTSGVVPVDDGLFVFLSLVLLFLVIKAIRSRRSLELEEAEVK